eukprot:g78315.t1
MFCELLYANYLVSNITNTSTQLPVEFLSHPAFLTRHLNRRFCSSDPKTLDWIGAMVTDSLPQAQTSSKQQERDWDRAVRNMRSTVTDVHSVCSANAYWPCIVVVLISMAKAASMTEDYHHSLQKAASVN